MSSEQQPSSLATVVPQLRLATADISERVRQISVTARQKCLNLRDEQFVRLAAQDLGVLFDLYDHHFFQGAIRPALPRVDALTFRVAPRMTSAGGKTYCTRRRTRQGKVIVERTDYQIAISSTLLFQSFAEVARPVRINGHHCMNRLQALQRVMEHEMLHLVEMLLWRDSSCAQPRFRELAANIFAHTEFTHGLVTPGERAKVKFDLVVGDLVTFTFEGRSYQGKVNRITRRATILVEDPRGERYSDGKHYRKFYVPLDSLHKQ